MSTIINDVKYKLLWEDDKILPPIIINIICYFPLCAIRKLLYTYKIRYNVITANYRILILIMISIYCCDINTMK